jgi:voltage-gated potassium channel
MLAFLRFKNPLFKLAKPILFFLFIMGIGTVGYVAIEKFTFLEALYMTVVTLSTVGYMEVKPLSDAGRYFTIVIILTNLSLLTFYLTILTRYFTDGEFVNDFKSYTMQNKIDTLSNHVIICGFGRNGLAASNIFKANNIPFVIIESTKEQIEKRNVHVEHFMIADATKDETLIEAGIHRAKAIITTLPDDAANLYTVLTARELNKSITIISRASNDASVKKLKIAGANNVIMPDKIGGIHMATLVSSPDINEFIDIIAAKSSNDFLFQELEIQQSFTLNKTEFLSKSGATIIGIKKADNSYILNPEESIGIEKNWKLILMCTKDQMVKAKAFFA